MTTPLTCLLLLSTLAAPPPGGVAAGAEAPPPSQAESGLAHFAFTDGETMRLRILDAKLTLISPFGKLEIPLSRVEGVELVARPSKETAEKLPKLIAQLGHSDFRMRESASAELLELGEAALAALIRARGHQDAETRARSAALVDKIREAQPEHRRELTDLDVVLTTDGDRISGQLTAESLRVDTRRFGEQTLPLSQVQHWSRQPPAPPVEVLEGPDNLRKYEQQIGQVFHFRVTGAAQGNLWGTDTYTSDSTLAMAVVHAGLLQPGQTGVVRVKIVASPAMFEGSARNAVSSTNYSQSYSGAYRFEPMPRQPARPPGK